MVNTQRRDRYLNALGVVRYVPRDSYDVVAERAAPAKVAAGTQTAAQADTRSGSPEQSVTAVVETPAAEKPHKPPAKKTRDIESPAETESAEAIHFRLAFWQPSDQLVVLSSMPSGVRPGQGQQEMLANLLRAIGHLPQPLPRVELLDWPMSPGADASLEGARELLTAFLGVKHRLKPFSRALLMGDTAARLVGSEATPAVGEKVPLSCGAEGVVTHSLYEMDGDKNLKRDTWAAIRFLAGGSA